MARRFGKSAITWTSSSEATEHVHQLQAPLRELIPAQNMVTYIADSLDRTVREVQHIGGGAAELGATVRYDMGGQSLIDMIVAGSKGKTLTWYPNTQDPDTSYDVKLIAPLAPSELALDAQRARFGDHSVQLRFRRTDQSAFTRQRYRGTDVLFAYKAGDSLTGSTFTRGTDASYQGKGYGTLAQSTQNQARLIWVSTIGTTGIRDTPALLLEGAEGNTVPESADFNQWANVGSLTRTSEQTDPYETSSAFKVADTSTTTNGYLESTGISPGGSTFGVLSMFIAASNQANQTSGYFGLYSSDSTEITRTEYKFTYGVPAVSYVSGSSVAPAERFTEGFWRIQNVTTSALNNASTYTVRFSPVAGGVGDTGDAYFFGAQLEV
jgi:hypothetical protein